jgi:hypothetical protein
MSNSGEGGAAGVSITDVNTIIGLLKEMLRWVKVSAFPQARRALRAEFAPTNGDEATLTLKRQVYALTDGKNSRSVIAQALTGKVRPRTVTDWQQRWRRIGLAEAVNPLAEKSKTRAVFNLEDFGMRVEVPKPSAAAQAEVIPQANESAQEAGGAQGGDK